MTEGLGGEGDRRSKQPYTAAGGTGASPASLVSKAPDPPRSTPTAGSAPLGRQPAPGSTWAAEPLSADATPSAVGQAGRPRHAGRRRARARERLTCQCSRRHQEWVCYRPLQHATLASPGRAHTCVSAAAPALVRVAVAAHARGGVHSARVQARSRGLPFLFLPPALLRRRPPGPQPARVPQFCLAAHCPRSPSRMSAPAIGIDLGTTYR